MVINIVWVPSSTEADSKLPWATCSSSCTADRTSSTGWWMLTPSSINVIHCPSTFFHCWGLTSFTLNAKIVKLIDCRIIFTNYGLSVPETYGVILADMNPPTSRFYIFNLICLVLNARMLPLCTSRYVNVSGLLLLTVT